MKKFLKTMFALILSMTTVFALTCHPVMAHDMWLDVRDYTPAKGEDISLTIAYDHYFPTRGFMNPDDLEEIYIRNKNGEKINFKAFSDVEIKADTPLKEAGTYVISAKRKGGFFTKTTEGYKRGQTKKGLSNVIRCGYYAKYSKAIINVGEAAGSAFSKALNHELEIIPLADPGTLKQGDFLPIRVLLKGAPLPSCQINATYMGFSSEKNTFAYATKTDNDGRAKIKMLVSGLWLIKTSHMEDYPDPEECDDQKFSATMTFEIK